MSFNRENEVWQSEDGTWSIGFWEVVWEGSESDGYDPEWDVEYGDNFDWVSSGHPTEQAAHDSWDGANPGGGSMMEWSETNRKEIEALDAKRDAAIAKYGKQTRSWW